MIDRKLIIDEEVDLNNCDFLKTKVYSDNLTEIIKNTPVDKVFTIGVFGKWGTGKSSIINTCKNDFNENEVKFVIYDAWQYCNDSFRRMFLRKLKDDLKYEEKDLMKKFYENESIDVGETYKFNWKNIPISIFILAFFVIISIVFIFLIGKDSWKIGLTFLAVIQFVSLIYTIFQGFILKLKVSVTKPHFFAPEQFDDCFNEIISHSIKRKKPIERILKWVIGDKAINNLEKIIIVIDNIDRCSSEIAYNLLTDIKTFLSTKPYNIVFIIPVDDEALRKHILNNKNEIDCIREKEEFLRKFFNLTIRIKPYQHLEMYTFASELNKKYNLNFNNDTLSLVSKEFSTNPRRIIQLFNNLTIEQNLYSNDFAIKNEAIICALIILKEEYGEFHSKVINDPTILFDNHEIENAELASFMRIADSYFKNAEFSNIIQILTNTKAHFNIIPNEIQEAIRTFDNIKVISYMDKNKENNKIILQLIQHNMAIDSQFQAELQMVNWLNFVCIINNKILIEHDDLIKLDNLLKKYYNDIVSKSNEANSICKLANQLAEIDIKELKDTIIDFISKNKENDQKNIEIFIKAVLEEFISENDSKFLSQFADDYFSNNWIDKEIFYSDFQMRYLFTDKLLSTLIKNIKELVQDEHSKEVLWVFNNKPNILIETYSLFFSHIYTIIENMKSFNKKDFILIINYLLPFVISIGNGKIKTEIKELYDKLFDTALINELLIIENKEDAELIIDILYHIYRITNSNISIEKQINIFISYHRPFINKKLVELLNQKYTLKPLTNIILNDEEYSSDDTITLLKNCIMQKKDDGTRYVSNEKLTNKINSLLNNIENKNVIQLINDLIKDELILQIVINDIVNRESEYINLLPIELLNLAVNAFTSESAQNYSENYIYLSIIAQKGDNTQKSELVKLLLNDMDNKKNIEEVLSILEELTITKTTDIKLIEAHLSSYKEGIQDDNIELNNRIVKLIQKYNVKEKKVKKTRKKHE